MVVVDGWAHVKPLFWAPLFPTVHMRVISFVHLSMTDGTHAALLPRGDSTLLHCAIAPARPEARLRHFLVQVAVSLRSMGAPPLGIAPQHEIARQLPSPHRETTSKVVSQLE